MISYSSRQVNSGNYAGFRGLHDTIRGKSLTWTKNG